MTDNSVHDISLQPDPSIDHPSTDWWDQKLQHRHQSTDQSKDGGDDVDGIVSARQSVGARFGLTCGIVVGVARCPLPLLDHQLVDNLTDGRGGREASAQKRIERSGVHRRVGVQKRVERGDT